MSIGTAPASPTGPLPPPALGAGAAKYIERQLNRTRWQVRLVDLAAGAITLLAGSLAYLLVMAACDHWLPEGLSGGWRWLAFLLFVVLAATIAARRLFPPLFRRVNPVYAAQTIERHQPSLKNSLINFLLLRTHAQEMPPAVFEAVEQQAAADLAGMPAGDTAVDRGAIIRWGYVLAAALAIVGLYKLVSPKDPFRSMERVIAPWADLAAPTRVSFASITPGDARAQEGRFLTVRATIHGLRDGEEAVLHYAPVGTPDLERQIALTLPANATEHEAKLPNASTGLTGDVDYYLVAGDARSPRYRVVVAAVPTIELVRADYQYPAYLELAPKSDALADKTIRGPEGAQVVLTAQASSEIQAAYLDVPPFSERGRFSRSPADMAMRVEGRTATVTLPLELGDAGEARYPKFRVIFSAKSGQVNEYPHEYALHVTPDLPPNVAIVDPAQPAQPQTVSAGGLFLVAVDADDPDHKLAGVRVVFERDGQPLVEKSVMSLPSARLERGQCTISTGEHGIKPGDTLLYWAEARDNKQPKPNVRRTDKYQLQIARPNQAPPPKPEPPPRNQQPPHKPGAQAPQKPPDGPPPPDGAKPPPPPPGAKQPPPPREQPANPPQAQPGGQGAQGQPNGPQPKDAQQKGANEPAGDRRGDQPPSPSDGGGNAAQEPPQRKIDPESDPGKFFEEARKVFEGDKPQPPAQETPPDKPQPGQQPEKPDARSQQPPQGEQGEGSEKSSQSQQKPQGGGQPTPDDPSKPGEKPQGGDGQQGGEPNQGNGPMQSGNKGQGSAPQGGGADGGAMNAPPQGASGNKPAGDSDQPGDSQQQGDARSGQTKPDAKPSSGARRGDKSSSAGAQGQGKPAGDETPGDQQTGEKPDGNPSGEKQPTADHGENSQGDAQKKPGDGDKTQPGQMGANDAKPGAEKQPGEAQGGDAQTPKGTAGAGQQEGEQKGSPSPQHNNTPTGNKQPGGEQTSRDNKSEGEQGKSPSTSNRESNSNGESSGDRSGGGKDGGGQNAPKPGTGGAGSNTDAQEGGAKSDQSGMGEDSTQGGDKTAAERPTNGAKSGNQPGAGSRQRPQGNQPGGGEQPGGQQKSGGQPGGNQPTGAEGSSPQGEQNGSGRTPPKNGQRDASQVGNGAPVAGGGPPPGNASNPPPPPKRAEPGASAPNLDYANQTVDLVLEKLDQQLRSGQVDPELLRRTKTTPAELQQLVDRWRALQQQARQSGEQGEAARRQYNDLLRGLGLRPNHTNLPGDSRTSDNMRDMRGGTRSGPPSEYAEQYRAYSTGQR